MKILKLVSLFTLLISSSAFAIDCPKYKLKCELQKINSKYAYETVLERTEEFEAFNRDEPSLPPDTCEIGLSFTSDEVGLTERLHATVTEDLEGFMYVGKGYGAMDPQFQLTVEPGKRFSLYFNARKMVCVLKNK